MSDDFLGGKDHMIVRRPNPGGRRSNPEAEGGSGGTTLLRGRTVLTGPAGSGTNWAGSVTENPLIDASRDLLQIAARVYDEPNQRELPPVEEIRQKIRQEIDGCIARLRNLRRGDTADKAVRAVVALLDDVFQNKRPWGTPWVGSGSLQNELFGINDLGDRVYDWIEEELANVRGRDQELLELFYVCLRMRFMGKYGPELMGARGEAGWQSVTDRVYEAVRRPMDSGTLSPDVRPYPAKQAGLARSFFWYAVPVAIILIGFAFLALRSDAVDAGTDVIDVADATQRALIVPASVKTPAPPPPRPVIPDRPPAPPAPPAPPCEVFRGISGSLEGLRVEVLSDRTNRAHIRMIADEMFKSAQAELANERIAEDFRRIAQRLEDHSGELTLIGHSDTQRLRDTRRFRDNRELSLRRAEAVEEVMRPILPWNRITIDVQGLGFAEPVVSPERTAEDRAQNRRVELIFERDPSAGGCK